MKKLILGLAIFSLLLAPAFSVLADDENGNGGVEDPTDLGEPQESCVLIREITYQGIGGVEGTPVNYELGNGAGAIVCMLNTVYRITNVIFTAMMVLVMFLVIAGGFFILTGGQNPDNVSKGKSFITYAMIGFAVALLAWIIPWIVRFIVQ